MSLFMSTNLVCPECEALIVMDAVGSVNADRRPDLRDDIMNNQFQDITCPSCDSSFRLQPNFNYLDAGRGQWIAGMPTSQFPDFERIGQEVSDLFDSSYGVKAPAAAQSVGEGLDVRLTFGWPAIREKLLAREKDLDDVTLELLKLELMRRVPEAPFGDDIELRLVNVQGDLMTFVWYNSETEDVINDFVVRYALYEEVANAQEAWASLRARLEDSIFVDMRKLFMGNEAAA
ncbi:MAG: CpXC domain-containing protein [Arenibacterium sp.]